MLLFVSSLDFFMLKSISPLLFIITNLLRYDGFNLFLGLIASDIDKLLHLLLKTEEIKLMIHLNILDKIGLRSGYKSRHCFSLHIKLV